MRAEGLSVGEDVRKEVDVGGEVEELLSGHVDAGVREAGMEIIAGVGDKLEPVQLGGDEVDGVGRVEDTGDVASDVGAWEVKATGMGEGESLMEGAEGGKGEAGSGRVDEGKGAGEARTVSATDGWDREVK